MEVFYLVKVYCRFLKIMFICLCVVLHISAVPGRSQVRVSDPPELEVQAAVGRERNSARAVRTCSSPCSLIFL